MFLLVGLGRESFSYMHKVGERDTRRGIYELKAASLSGKKTKSQGNERLGRVAENEGGLCPAEWAVN